MHVDEVCSFIPVSSLHMRCTPHWWASWFRDGVMVPTCFLFCAQRSGLLPELQHYSWFCFCFFFFCRRLRNKKQKYDVNVEILKTCPLNVRNQILFSSFCKCCQCSPEGLFLWTGVPVSRFLKIAISSSTLSWDFPG